MRRGISFAMASAMTPYAARAATETADQIHGGNGEMRIVGIAKDLLAIAAHSATSRVGARKEYAPTDRGGHAPDGRFH